MEDNPAPQALDMEEAIEHVRRRAGKPTRIALSDATGEKVASVAGSLAAEAIEGMSQPLMEFVVQKDELTARLHIPLHPGTRFTLSADGVLEGRLPNGASWVHEPFPDP